MRYRRGTMRRILLWLPILLLGFAAWGDPGDEQWDTQFFSPMIGTGSRFEPGIQAMVTMPNGDIICAGRFVSVAGGVPGTTNLARWDGRAWSSVGGGFPGLASIGALAVLGQDLIVGGSFTSIQGQAITNLARWNGTQWSAVGGGVQGGAVIALAVQNGVLVVGGQFTNAGGTAAGYIATWNGTNWNNLNGGVQASSPSTQVPVRSVLVANGSIYAAGKFYRAGGIAATNVARWTGAAWQSLGQGIGSQPNDELRALAADGAGRIFVGGRFWQTIGGIKGFVAAWDGVAWTYPGGGLTGSVGGVNLLLFHGTDLYAGGIFLEANGFARWNGSQWLTASEIFLSATALTPRGTDLFVAGGVATAQSGGVNALGKMDGSGRSEVFGNGLAGDGGLIQAVSVTADKVLVGGALGFGGTFGQSYQVAAQWDQKDWSVPGDGLRNLSGSSAPIEEITQAQDGVYALGQFALPNGQNANGIARLENNHWQRVGSGLRDRGLTAVSRGRELIVGHRQGVSRWTGSAWTELGPGLSGPVYALALAGRDIYAGGSFTNSGSTAMRNLAKWDGTNWSSVGLGVNGTVRALAVQHDDLFVGGDFTEAGGIPCARVARWRQTTWSPLGPGFSNGVLAASPLLVGLVTNEAATTVLNLTVAPGGTLFAGGNFTSSGANPRSFVAQWDGNDWLPLGRGVNHWVRDLACDGRHLYAVGDFTKAGTSFSLRLARWSLAGLRLTVTASASPSVVNGSELVYRLTIRNFGDEPVGGTIVSMPVPAGTSWLGASNGGLPLGGRVQWTVADLLAGQEQSLSATVRVSTATSELVLQDYTATAGGTAFSGPPLITPVTDGTESLTLAISEPQVGTTVPHFSDVRITFSPANAVHGLRQVDVYRNDVFLTSLLSPPYSLLLTNLRAGTNRITGIASDYGVGTATASTMFVVQRPANDDFANRTVLSGISTNVEGVTIDATVEAGEPSHDGFWKNNSIWWSWMAPADGRLTLDSTASDFGHLLGVYRGSALTSLEALAREKNAPGPFGSMLAIDVQKNTNYQIVIDGGYPFIDGHAKLKLSFDHAPTVSILSPTNGAAFAGPTNIAAQISVSDVEGPLRELQLRLDGFTVASQLAPVSQNYHLPTIAGGSFTLTAEVSDLVDQHRSSSPASVNVPLANDSFARRVRLSGYRFVGFGTTVGAGYELGEPGLPVGGAIRSAWWEWTAPISAQATLAADSAEYSAGIQVYTGSTLAQLSLVGDASNNFGHNELSFPAVAGEKYQVRVDGFHFASETAAGKYRLTGSIMGSDQIQTRMVRGNDPQQLSLQTEGPVGMTFVLETSTNLVNWSPVSTNVSSLTVTEVPLPTSTSASPVQFFRVFVRP